MKIVSGWLLGTGARMALISQDRCRVALEITAKDGYIELARIPEFNIRFAEASSMVWQVGGESFLGRLRFQSVHFL